MAQLAPGFRFDPTDKVLLENYLKPKVCGNLPWDIIKEKEIYGPNANPWEIFNDSTTQWITRKHEKLVYVFARLTKIADKESSGVGNEHNVRKAGCGTWHDETGRKPVMDGKDLIGHMRMLVFQINDINGLGDGVDLDMVGYWKMHEFFLHGHEDYVVCRITFDASKRAKVIKAVSETRGSTKSKANKKIATICTTKDDRGKAVLIESSHTFRDDRGKAVLIENHDSRMVDSNNIVEGGGVYIHELSYENQGSHEENNGMMFYQNLPASTNSVSCYGSDQGLILNKVLPQYDGGNFRVEEQAGQGLEVNDDQRLMNYEEEARPVIPTSGNIDNQLGTVLSDFNSGPDDGLYLDLEDLFDGDFWLDKDNVLQDQSMSKDDVSLDFEEFFDIGDWSDKQMEELLGQVNGNVQEQQQQPMQNMSCMLGKRESFEAQEDYSGPGKKSRF